MNNNLSGATEREVIIVGGGAWGTTLALVALRANCRVTLLVRSERIAEAMRLNHVHPRSLPGVTLPEDLIITADAEHALSGTAPVIMAVPTQALRGYMIHHANNLQRQIVVSAAKGLEIGTMQRPSEIIVEVLGQSSNERIAVLSGPNLATEIAAGKPAATVIASMNPRVAQRAQRLLLSSSFRTYASPDVIGVELGGALKNIMAIGAGIADGLHAGDNAKASLLTRGIAEITRLGVACGANAATFGGLSGIGDLMATCASNLSRNYRVGFGIASGRSLTDILAQQSETAEGVPTTLAALDLAASHGVELPIASQVARVLFQGVSPQDAMEDLMGRRATDELAE